MRGNPQDVVLPVTHGDFSLSDDGTLDTVIVFRDPTTDEDETLRFAQETAAPYRDEGTGALDWYTFLDEVVIPSV